MNDQYCPQCGFEAGDDFPSCGCFPQSLEAVDWEEVMDLWDRYYDSSVLQ